jgi:hypothetical protein
MLRSIQEIGKKINSSLSIYDCISLSAVATVSFGLALYVGHIRSLEKKPVIYREGRGGQILGVQADSRPFGSRNGTTYTYSWCSGSGQIKPENKIYFAGSAEAEKAGRTLSKLCSR